MKIGMELDPIEELDREEKRAIAAVVRARFEKGDLDKARRDLEVITARRMKLRERQVELRYA